MKQNIPNLFKLLIIGTILSFLVSCSSKTYKNINYFQDVKVDSTWNMVLTKGIVIQPKDQISIVVSSRNPELSAMFNLPVATYQAGSEMTTTGSGYQKLLGYAVDNDGYIDFPVLGKLYVAGLSRWELADKIKSMLVEQDYIKDPVVTVQFMNFKISVMGEVNGPGTYDIQGDKITILEALSLSRDLTIFGRRDNISVIREQNGVRKIFKLDLRSSELFSSPAYYLQQNDIVYVEPNKVRAGQSTINENVFKSATFWTSVGSFLTSVASLIIVATR